MKKMKRSLVTILGVFALLAFISMPAFAQEKSIRGQLGRTVEPGGWLILSGNDKYLLLNAKNYEKETWFVEGTEVAATGVPKPDMVTTFMEGIPFEVRTLQPATGGGATAVRGRSTTRVQVTGTSMVQAQPDTAILSISVVTQNKNALEAQQQNASLSESVIRAVKAAAGAGAEVKTSGYVLTPQRVYKENQPPTISGYEVRNSITVTTGELQKVGAVIDAAGQAGANNVDNVSFTLRKDDTARNQALSEATREAIAKANVIARVLGGKVVRIIAVDEDGGMPRPIYQVERMTDIAQAKSTPIEVGTLELSSKVQLIAEVETVN
jgi:uncharacterized protein YggE